MKFMLKLKICILCTFWIYWDPLHLLGHLFGWICNIILSLLLMYYFKESRKNVIMILSNIFQRDSSLRVHHSKINDLLNTKLWVELILLNTYSYPWWKNLRNSKLKIYYIYILSGSIVPIHLENLLLHSW